MNSKTPVRPADQEDDADGDELPSALETAMMTTTPLNPAPSSTATASTTTATGHRPARQRPGGPHVVPDADGDGFGDAADTETACESPEGYTDDDRDCDDTDPREFPGAVWTAMATPTATATRRVHHPLHATAGRICRQRHRLRRHRRQPPARRVLVSRRRRRWLATGQGARWSRAIGRLVRGRRNRLRRHHGTVHPEAEEIRADGIDQDCDGEDVRWVTITGEDYACGVDNAGGSGCWGRQSYGETAIPDLDFTVAEAGQAIPAGSRPMEPWSAGVGTQRRVLHARRHLHRFGAWAVLGCGIRTSGTIACWGPWAAEDIPTGAHEQIDGYDREVCALTPTGLLRCWGEADGHRCRRSRQSVRHRLGCQPTRMRPRHRRTPALLGCNF